MPVDRLHVGGGSELAIRDVHKIVAAHNAPQLLEILQMYRIVRTIPVVELMRDGNGAVRRDVQTED